jgi:hypothetical protein
MTGNVEVGNLKGIMDVRLLLYLIVDNEKRLFLVAVA